MILESPKLKPLINIQTCSASSITQQGSISPKRDDEDTLNGDIEIVVPTVPLPL